VERQERAITQHDPAGGDVRNPLEWHRVQPRFPTSSGEYPEDDSASIRARVPSKPVEHIPQRNHVAPPLFAPAALRTTVCRIPSVAPFPSGCHCQPSRIIT
jgi:hypothetical protein